MVVALSITYLLTNGSWWAILLLKRFLNLKYFDNNEKASS